MIQGKVIPHSEVVPAGALFAFFPVRIAVKSISQPRYQSDANNEQNENNRA
jgi:hypothetical protein